MLVFRAHVLYVIHNYETEIVSFIFLVKVVSKKEIVLMLTCKIII